MLRAVAVFGGLAASSASFIAWNKDTSIESAGRFAHGSREDLVTAISGARSIHAFAFSDIAPVKLGSLMSVGPLRQVAADIRSAPSSIFATASTQSETAYIVDALKARGCSVTVVGDATVSGSDRSISLDAYTAELAAPVSDDSACAGYLVSVSASSSVDLELVAKATRAAAGPAAFVISAEGAHAGDVAAAPELPLAAEGRPGAVNARRVQAVTRTAARVYLTGPGIVMTPGILTGLLVGLLLLFFTLVGLSCVASVRVPDVLHSTTLMAGKEY